MFCIYCGEKIAEDSIFCRYCGKKQKLDIINYEDYYIPKKYIITFNELKLYKVLLEIAKELDLVLLCQVSLYSIIQTKDKNSIYFNKIKSKSIDFVLVRERDCKINLCIELDDKTHQYQHRIQRDEFVNKLFKDLEIPLLRIKSLKYYEKEAIKDIILPYLKDSV